jgi:phospholipid/cholesterol/gamma-HCH transport system permease protein
MSSRPLLSVKAGGEHVELAAGGFWTANHAASLETLIAPHTQINGSERSLSIDMAGVQAFDTFGAWLLEKLLRSWRGKGLEANVVGLPEHYQGLFEEVEHTNTEPALKKRSRLFQPLWVIESLGRKVEGLVCMLAPFLNMAGAFGLALARTIAQPKSFRGTSMVNHLDRVGWQAVPIILLISFLIGCIIAQQGIFHFRKYGADIYVVDMVGVLVLREIGVLIVCIMVAGRSGSAYTAELGAMKMREEIDALRTMGFDPVSVLIIPRVLALVLAVPILTFLGSMAALYGGGLVAWQYGGMSPDIFLERLQQAISTTHFSVGMIKAPFMALIIGLVACSEGLLVKGSAESLGSRTTISVVKSIFLVIVMDGVFAIFFASVGM